MTNSEKIMQALRHQIKTHGSQTKFAEKVGVTPQYISQLQKGANPVTALSIDMLEKLFPDVVEINFNWKKRTPIQEQLIQFISGLSEDEQTRALQILQMAFPPQQK